MFDDLKERVVRFFSDPVSVLLGIIVGSVFLACLRFIGLDLDRGLDTFLDLVSGRTAAHERKMHAAAAKAKIAIDKCEAEKAAAVADLQTQYDAAVAEVTVCEQAEENHRSHGGPDAMCDSSRTPSLKIHGQLNAAKRVVCSKGSTAN